MRKTTTSDLTVDVLVGLFLLFATPNYVLHCLLCHWTTLLQVNCIYELIVILHLLDMGVSWIVLVGNIALLITEIWKVPACLPAFPPPQTPEFL